MEEKDIKRQLNKIKKLFVNIDQDKRTLCDGLIQNAAFMAVTLTELQKEIKEKGPVITSINGNGFEVVQENPAQKSYNTMINRYSSVIRQLTDLLPDSVQETDEFLDFIGGKN